MHTETCSTKWGKFSNLPYKVYNLPIFWISPRRQFTLLRVLIYANFNWPEQGPIAHHSQDGHESQPLGYCFLTKSLKCVIKLHMIKTKTRINACTSLYTWLWLQFQRWWTDEDLPNSLIICSFIASKIFYPRCCSLHFTCVLDKNQGIWTRCKFVNIWRSNYNWNCTCKSQGCLQC